MVFVELWNKGRGGANQPVFEAQVFLEKVPRSAEYSGNFQTDVALLDSIPLQITTNTFDYRDDDELANQFFQRGIAPVDYLAGKQSGKKILFGISFEGGSKFYIPAREALEPVTLPLGDDKDRYAWFAARARNSPKKVVAKNVKLTLPSWLGVKLDYRDREADIALAKEMTRVLVEPYTKKPKGEGQ